MKITRRDFLKYCTASAAALGLSASGLQRLEAALASDGAPTIIWLHGSGCQGDSVSFLNLFANLDPVGDVTAGAILLDYVNLAYHTVVMAAVGPRQFFALALAPRMEVFPGRPIRHRPCRLPSQAGRQAFSA